MDAVERRKLIRIITKKTGLKIPEFTEKVINSSYASFTYRLANDALTLSDYHAIIAATGMSFEQIWPMPGVKKELPIVQVSSGPATDKTPITISPTTTNTTSKVHEQVTPGSKPGFVPVIPDAYNDPEALMSK